MPDVFTTVHRAPIISAACRNNVAAAYWQSPFARDGGLLSYGPDVVDIFRGRLCRSHSTPKFEIAVNLKTAKALDLTVPQSILLSADEVIE